MVVNMKGKHLASLHDLTKEEIWQILKTAETLKIKQKTGEKHELLYGKTLAMIFQKPSTRTRVSFEVGMKQLGGHALYLSSTDLQLGRGETVGDTGAVLSRYCDGIMARVFSHDNIIELCKHSTVPVINGLSDLLHPCQCLADLETILEKKQEFKGLKLAFVGDGNNVCHSLMFGSAKVGMEMTVICPKGYEPDKQIEKLALEDGLKLEVTNDPKGVKDADVIYTDVWASMGKDKEHEDRVKIFKPYQVNEKLISQAQDDCIVMHCLPAHRGEEITNEVVDGPHSVVLDQAENRNHAQKAVMALLM
ncbi:MAG: Ornithine carbamoyltransferase [Candidatus Methanofastidiosum methylothiophilum]|jgi:ornithine carbamoyltransferase|uniref:Ornithine carbamoyltransferase n=1 Tax=Candidatus Methanofastidiosum methylothiophilum TaxID=1705564 RepID=A0A150JDH6_9EURY|nr:MAG: Ornithine carbamoyltransferase [Candidatus Methanofastidiosum methylthiophilus]MBP6931929.1 ornithine carbamoyltransferase [Methanofastidiosum sp.]OQC52564.1 MAG: Ornithine carbamoyltransferase [Euryarchaeota archaeon ADurb.Bin023]KYC57147.1 MAG: Ornithine carbamoyltransferase [Candidatus Methanofastidiosum methylthiophilus]KYC57903.1 MAG: Ornithine carbamoyltransferase [Candidatus Methanofastidiosum methylthiophilus]